MDSSTATLQGILNNRVQILLAASAPHEALEAATEAVQQAKQTLGTDLESIDTLVSALEVRAEIHRLLQNNQPAADDELYALKQLSGRTDRYAKIGKLYTGLGSSYSAMGDYTQAAEKWGTATTFYERHVPPMLPEVAAVANYLGELYRIQGDVDSAENHFLKALEILHKLYGENHEQSATVTHNLAYLYLTAGFYEQARQMNEIALETRGNLLGEKHPDTALSHNNLALALSQTGDRSWARVHFEKALADFELLGSEHHNDLKAVTANYCRFLREEGEADLAANVEERISIATK